MAAINRFLSKFCCRNVGTLHQIARQSAHVSICTLFYVRSSGQLGKFRVNDSS